MRGNRRIEKKKRKAGEDNIRHKRKGKEKKKRYKNLEI